VLVDAHLLTQPESRDRFRLHDIVNRYARELAIGSEERSAAEARLICFYLFSANNVDRLVIAHRPGVELPSIVEGVAPMEFMDEDTAMRWAVRERANINAVLRYALDRGLHIYVSKLPSTIGEVFQRLGYRDDVATALQMAIRSAQISHHAFEQANSLGNLAFVQVAQRDFESAMENVLSARMIFQQIDNARGVAITDYYMGRLQVERGDVPRGIASHLKALTALQRMDNVQGEELIVMYRLGESYRRAGNLDAAASFCHDALRSADRIGDTYNKSCVLTELALIHLERGAYSAARGYCVRALGENEHLEPAQSGKIYRTLASIHFACQEYQSAERCARRALTYFRGARLDLKQAATLCMIAESVYHQARHDEAVDCWVLALSLLDSAGERQAADEVRQRLAEVAAVPPVIPQERTEPMRTRPTTGSTR
jgi:tetratricopeptide (TPR) repeat protein